MFFELASTILIASLVPAILKASSDLACSSSVGLIINLPSTNPTSTPAIGPLNGISEIINAKDDPSIAVIAGELSGSLLKTMLIICTSSLNPSGNKGLIGRSIKRAFNVSTSDALPSLLKNPPGILPAAYSFS